MIFHDAPSKYIAILFIATKTSLNGEGSKSKIQFYLVKVCVQIGFDHFDRNQFDFYHRQFLVYNCWLANLTRKLGDEVQQANYLELKEENESHKFNNLHLGSNSTSAHRQIKPRRALKYCIDQPSPGNAETWYLEAAW